MTPASEYRRTSHDLVQIVPTRPGHACPDINYFKLTFFAVSYLSGCYMCPVSCCWPKFQSIFSRYNPLQQTTGNNINAKM